MRQVRVQDLITQSTVSILNLAYRRIAKADERDLEQARAGIDAVGALAGQLEPEAQREILNALSQVRMEYAKHAADAGEEAGSRPAAGGAPGPGSAPAGGGEAPPSRQSPPPGLWVPGSD